LAVLDGLQRAEIEIGTIPQQLHLVGTPQPREDFPSAN